MVNGHFNAEKLEMVEVEEQSFRRITLLENLEKSWASIQKYTGRQAGKINIYI